MHKGLKFTLIAVAFLIFLILLGGLILSRVISDYISPTKAEEILLDKHPDAVITDIETESASSGLYYELDFLLQNTRHSATIDGKSGAIIGDTADRLPYPESKTINPVPDIQAATEKALADAGFTSGDVTITDAELENKDGHTMYKIKFLHEDVEYEYLINAQNGDIEVSISSPAD